jgi:MarR family transcriptional regulator, organic hydroperoxide resistance regulator
MKPEETIDFHIRWAWHRIARLYNSAAAKYGGSMSIGYVLLNIDPEGTPSTKLGPKMGMEARSLTRMLKDMEEEGLIKRVADAKDKRMARVMLTSKGKQMRDVSRDTVIRFNDAVRSEIPKKDLDHFRSVMMKLNELLERKELLS